ncbi:MAG: polyphosphate kinase 2 family protein [bacterium]|nr:polyphosphate kinase 2 family protein [bacterium]
MSDRIIEPVPSEFLVPFDGTFRVADAPTAPSDGERGKQHKKRHKQALAAIVDEMRELQRAMYAFDSHSLLLVFQAMDAAGKDGTIRAVMSGINPAGCQVSSFKAPSKQELDHDFLWRVATRLPERGRIGIFNRSHYEEVLVVRVHPEYLESQRLPGKLDLATIWQERFESIRNFEQHLARNGTTILKFWLNVGRDEQRRRFIDRIDEPESNWKFEPGDVAERRHWSAYMRAYEEALCATSRPWAPWYAIPADDKPFMRRTVADLVRRALKAIRPRYPEPTAAERAAMQGYREELLRDD